MLYQGKDKLQKLCDIHMQFRRFSVACCCDIQEMFMQYGINEDNRDFLKTLKCLCNMELMKIIETF